MEETKPLILRIDFEADLDGEHLTRSLAPKYLPAVPADVYGQPFVVTMNGAPPAVISLGRGGFLVQKQNVVIGEP